ncbi:nuclear pore complex assembly-domain-containing protein [Massariosphaeria phaeospora]|uniref:Nuclear pore complex assembly-domain-containing protein n=1 Tax=Massariosphaeria phaeospora TaxID=100035 RepID=A0A7C8MJP7_9PLEO|nr:nuclear pore complex assembly-domain-containing protein [Massariosphaeria phaeospora]
MLDIEEYKAVFPAGVGYTSGLIESIEWSKNELGGTLFFMRLLEVLKLKEFWGLYPPKSGNQLRELHQQIVDAEISLHSKHSLLFYLLKDLSPSHHNESELAAAFAGKVHLENRYWTFIEGLWSMDHLDFETAVGSLTHPSIIPTFSDEIMDALLSRKHDEAPGEDTSSDDILPLAYYNCTKPPLEHENNVKHKFVLYMARRNVTETFYWIRERPEFERKELLELLVKETLGGDTLSFDKDKSKYTREDKATELVSLPFDEQEEEWIEAFLVGGAGRHLKRAADTVLMRRIATGRLQDVARDVKTKGERHDGINWESLKAGVKRGLGPRKEEDSRLVV